MPLKPSDSEQEWIHREEATRLRAMREETAQETVDAEKDRLKKDHWMRCPKCGMELAEIDFRGIQVDACFACGGMFFDHGEVDKLTTASEPGILGKMTAAIFGRS